MISVTHLITTLETGGAERMMERLIGAMDAREFATRVINLTSGGAVQERLIERGIPVLSLGMRRGVPSPGGLLRLTRELRRNPPDVLQTWLYHADLIGLIAGRLAGVRPILWNVRCSELGPASRTTVLVRRALRALSSRPEAIVTNSHAAVDVHRRFGYRARRWVVIPNGFDLERFRPDPAARLRVRGRLGIPEHAFVIGTVGRADPVKDYPTLLSAARSFLEDRREEDVAIVLAGSGLDDPALTRDLPDRARERFRVLGETDDVPGIMAAMDVFTLTSVAEGFPNVVGEAMACGVPCVVSDVGDAARLVGDGGIVVPPSSPRPIEAAWKRLLSAPEERRRMGESARRRIEEHYALPAAVAKYEGLYREMANARGGTRAATAHGGHGRRAE